MSLFLKSEIPEKYSGSIEKEIIYIVKKSGNNLLEILNGIMEVSRIESGVCEIDNEKFILNQIFAEAVDSFRGHEKISSGRILLVNEAENSPQLFVVSDRLKIVEILINLVSNAIKNTETGTVTAGFKLIDDEKFSIQVKDTGNGIDNDNLELIFNRFQQANLEPYNPRDGVGLGLTIVKGYTELLGGSIQIKSELGKGTEFNLLLPVDSHGKETSFI